MARTKSLLHVGCGPKRIKHLPKFFHKGWEEVRLDIDEAVEPDITGTLTDLQNLKKSKYDMIWSSHNIEHVFHHEAPGVCAGFKHVLKKSGMGDCHLSGYKCRNPLCCQTWH